MTLEKEVKNHKDFTTSRIRSLYSDFSNLRLLNPEGYDANINAWKSLLTSLLRGGHLGVFSFSSNILLEELSITGYGEPLAIGEVIQLMTDSEILIPKSVFELSTRSFLPTREQSQFSTRAVIAWVAKRAGLGRYLAQSSNGKLVKERYIDWKLLVEVGDKVCQHFQDSVAKGSYSDCLYTGRLFQLEIQRLLKRNIIDPEIQILITYLSRDRQVCNLHKNGGLEVLKFGNDPISEEDIAVANLRDNAVKISEREVYLHEKIDANKSLIKGLLTQGKDELDDVTRQRIKSLLSTKNILTKSFASASELSIQLSTVLSKIDDSSNNVNTFNLLSQSSAVLKSMLSDINIDQVLDLKEELDGQMAAVDEISGAIAESPEHDEEIEQELMAMEQEVQDKQTKERIDQLPTAPDNIESGLSENMDRLQLSDPNDKVAA